MNFLIHDPLIFTDISNSLADGGKNKIISCSNWASGYPMFKDFSVGLGFENLKKTDKHGNPLLFWDHVEWADCIINWDVHGNDAIKFIKKMFPEKSVWGAGAGERIESDRIALKQWIEALGLPVNPYKVIKGITALKKYISVNPGKYVKISIFRGDCESFFAKDLDFNRADFLKLETNLGPHAETMSFIVEDPIETDVEVGYDGFFNGENYSDKCFFGVEYHKNLYLAAVKDYEDLPEPFLETMDAFHPLLQKLDYRGAISTEEKIVDFKHHYLLDVCSRLPAPLSALYPLAIKNWPEFVYKTGKKEDCPLDIDCKYVGAFALSSQRGNLEYLPIELKKSDRDKVRFQSVCMVGDHYHGVKGNETIAVLVAQGDTKKEVLDKLKDYSKLVDAPGLETDDINGIDKINDIIDECAKKKIII